jgi:hypothetical protein
LLKPKPKYNWNVCPRGGEAKVLLECMSEWKVEWKVGRAKKIVGSSNTIECQSNPKGSLVALSQNEQDIF